LLQLIVTELNQNPFIFDNIVFMFVLIPYDVSPSFSNGSAVLKMEKEETDLLAPLVAVLNTLFTILNSPGELNGWQANGVDPCGQSWKGVTCSGSGFTKILLPNLGLSGNLAYNMNNLGSLTDLDTSQNSLGGGNQIQYNLPNMKLERLNLAGNQFGGNLPYSISTMSNLKYLNLNHNQLQGISPLILLLVIYHKVSLDCQA